MWRIRLRRAMRSVNVDEIGGDHLRQPTPLLEPHALRSRRCLDAVCLHGCPQGGAGCAPSGKRRRRSVKRRHLRAIRLAGSASLSCSHWTTPVAARPSSSAGDREAGAQSLPSSCPTLPAHSAIEPAAERHLDFLTPGRWPEVFVGGLFLRGTLKVSTLARTRAHPRRVSGLRLRFRASDSERFAKIPALAHCCLPARAVARERTFLPVLGVTAWRPIRLAPPRATERPCKATGTAFWLRAIPGA